MADIQLATQSSPATPSAGNAIAYFDTTTKKLSAKNDAGVVETRVVNYSTALQSPAATTRTYITGSALTVSTNKLQIGSQFRWVFSVTKTNAGTATSTYDICVGTNGTTADTARVSFTKPAGTAAVDEGTITIVATVRSIGATGVMVGQFTMVHNLSATGHMVIPCACVNTISAGFDMTVANLIVGVCVTSGASDALTFQLVQAEGINI